MDPLYFELRAWRSDVAGGMGVPEFAVLPDATLQAIADSAPQDWLGLTGIPGLGPRALIKFGSRLLQIVAAQSIRAQA
jgi:DNA helicase-2/ATP-dependent DNA helicase PcrA